jgi:hypothetical protein
VYARSEATRTLVETGYCTGELPWDENEISNSGPAK